MGLFTKATKKERYLVFVEEPLDVGLTKIKLTFEDGSTFVCAVVGRYSQQLPELSPRKLRSGDTVGKVSCFRSGLAAECFIRELDNPIAPTKAQIGSARTAEILETTSYVITIMKGVVEYK